MALLQTENGPVEVILTGPDKGPSALPVVFLHHGFGTVQSLAGLAQELAGYLPDMQAVLWSRAGCGASPPLPDPRQPDYLHRQADTALPALLDALEIRAAHLVGHSDGGSIALLAAALIPDRVRSVTTIAPHVMIEPCTIAGVRALAEAETPAFHRALAQRHADPNAAYGAWRDVWLSEAMQDWSITDLLPHITAPVGLIQGDGDAFGSFGQLDLIAASVRGACKQLRISMADHFPYKTHVSEIAEFSAQIIQQS